MGVDSRPLEAVSALDGSGVPWYPFLPGSDAPATQVLFVRTPILPTASSCWTRLADDDPQPRVRLDADHLAQLLYVADLQVDLKSPDLLLIALAHVLIRCRCNSSLLSDLVYQDVAEDNYGARERRLSQCHRQAMDLWETQ